MSDVSHRDLCWAACRWALQQRWSDAAAVEVGTVKHGVADVLATGKPDKAPKLVIFEVKRTRSDLLADLRAGKMEKYGELASHCYLLVHEACLLGDRRDGAEELAALGVPDGWGILLSTGERRDKLYPQSLRTARPLQKVSSALVEVFTRSLARSLTWRLANAERVLVQREVHIEELCSDLRSLRERGGMREDIRSDATGRVAHDAAMRAADEADRATGDVARLLYLRAMQLERQAAEAVEAEPSRGILHRSAATLALRAGEPEIATAIALRGLRPPFRGDPQVCEELREVHVKAAGLLGPHAQGAEGAPLGASTHRVDGSAK